MTVPAYLSLTGAILFMLAVCALIVLGGVAVAIVLGIRDGIRKGREPKHTGGPRGAEQGTTEDV